MSKVWEDEVIRDADTTEQTDIEKNGGGSSRFELIDTVNISEGISRIPRVIDNYDELFISISEIQGTGNLAIQAKVGTTTTRLTNFLTNTDKDAQILLQRVSEGYYLITSYGSGTTTTNNFVAVADLDNVSYDDKIVALIVTTGVSSNLITKGKIKIYGRNLTNE